MVSLTGPTNGQSFGAPATIPLAATASADTGLAITRVDFHNGPYLIASDTSPPYTGTWAGVAAGTYTVTATAHDNAGGSTTSAAAQLTVTASLKNKYVTILYETWADWYWQNFGPTNSWCTLPSPYDATCPVADNAVPSCPYGTFHWWGYPGIFGGDISQYRFINDDGTPNLALIDNHADLLAAAGIDFITIDYSNSNLDYAYFNNPTGALLTRFRDRMAQGLATPKVAFFNIGPSHAALFSTFYTVYPASLFFNVGGKPLLLAGDCSGATDFTCKVIRGLTNDASTWTFKNQTPQPIYVSNGWAEETSVAPAMQADYMNGCRGNALGRQGGATLDAQWNQVTNNSPNFVFVTGWNEWVSWNVQNGGLDPVYPRNRPLLTDEWNPEYSSDFEPMNGGHGSFYYDQLETKITSYKRNTPIFALRSASTGDWAFKYFAGASELAGSNFTSTFGWAAGASFQPINGDFDDDGYADIGLRDTSTGSWHFARRVAPYAYSHTNSFSWTAGANFQPVIADFDDDGHTDIALRDTSNGVWYFAQWVAPYTYAQTNSFAWAVGANYVPFVGDFTGDGHTDIGLRDTANGVWYLAQWIGSFSYTNNQSYAWAVGAHYQSVTGDWDGDDQPDIGLRDTTTGTIFLLNNSGGFSFGNQEAYLGPVGSDYTLRAVPNLPHGP